MMYILIMKFSKGVIATVFFYVYFIIVLAIYETCRGKYD